MFARNKDRLHSFREMIDTYEFLTVPSSIFVNYMIPMQNRLTESYLRARGEGGGVYLRKGCPDAEGGALIKVLYGKAPPQGSNPYSFIYHF